MNLFLCLSGISLERYCQKSLAKSGGFGKKDKKGRLPCRGMYLWKGGVQTFCSLWTPLKTSENLWFSDVLRGIKRGHWEEKG